MVIEPPIDPAFGHWLAGFIDGEGCFIVHLHHARGSLDCQFSISLRADDRAILVEIRDRLGMGTLSRETAHRPPGQNPKVRYSISSKSECQRLRSLLALYPLRAKKARDLIVWGEALDAWIAHSRGSWATMLAARDRLQSGRQYREEAA